MAELFKDIGVRRKTDDQLVNGGEALQVIPFIFPCLPDIFCFLPQCSVPFQGKLVAIYFSAHWCPPCRNFTPVLKQFYEQVIAAGEAFEIVFVSFDRSEQDLSNYLKESHGDWLYVPFGSPHIQSVQFWDPAQYLYISLGCSEHWLKSTTSAGSRL